MTLDDIILKTIGVEGKYSNNPKDSGGETMWGIVLATARRYGYTGPMRTMPQSEAIRIYKQHYLIEPGIDKINSINSRICAEVFDSAVNCSVDRPIEWLQISLNALNREGQDYPDLKEDGILGPITLATLQTFLRFRKLEGEIVLLKMLNVLQGAYYIDLSRNRQKDEAFVFGWFRTRIEIPLERSE